MGILAKYFCREFFKYLVICQVAFVFLYLIIDFIQKVDNFKEAHAPNYAMFLFFIYKIPFIAIQMAPVAALISAIIMFSLMKKNNEITALKACGISILRISLPVLIASMGLAITAFLFSESVVPYASTKSSDIWTKVVEKHDRKRFYNRNYILYKGSQAIYWIRHFDEKRMVMENPVFYFFDDSFRLTKRIDAQRAIWTGDRWKVEEGILQQVGEENTYELKRFEQMDLWLQEDPESFLKTFKHPEEMTYWELKRHAEKTAFEGYDDTRFRVDLNAKLSLPLLSFVMVLIGIPTALGIKKGGTPLAVSIGIAACFIYLLIHGVTRSLGFAGVLPPILSAWLASLAFLLLGIYMMLHLEK